MILVDATFKNIALRQQVVAPEMPSHNQTFGLMLGYSAKLTVMRFCLDL